MVLLAIILNRALASLSLAEAAFAINWLCRFFAVSIKALFCALAVCRITFSRLASAIRDHSSLQAHAGLRFLVRITGALFAINPDIIDSRGASLKFRHWRTAGAPVTRIGHRNLAFFVTRQKSLFNEFAVAATGPLTATHVFVVVAHDNVAASQRAALRRRDRSTPCEI